MRLKGRYINERKLTNVQGGVLEIDRGEGQTQLAKEIDAICMLPRKDTSMLQAREARKRQILRKIITVMGTLGIFLGAAAAVIYMAPALGTVLFAVIAWCGFAGMMTGE